MCPELTAEALVSSLCTVIAGVAAPRVLRTTFDQRGQPFEASVIVMRGDRNRFMLTLGTAGTTFSKVTSC